ncbi:MAG: hypothetical protein N2B06_08220 [Clostridium sp.]
MIAPIQIKYIKEDNIDIYLSKYENVDRVLPTFDGVIVHVQNFPKQGLVLHDKYNNRIDSDSIVYKCFMKHMKPIHRLKRGYIHMFLLLDDTLCNIYSIDEEELLYIKSWDIYSKKFIRNRPIFAKSYPSMLDAIGYYNANQQIVISRSQRGKIYETNKCHYVYEFPTFTFWEKYFKYTIKMDGKTTEHTRFTRDDLFWKLVKGTYGEKDDLPLFLESFGIKYERLYKGYMDIKKSLEMETLCCKDGYNELIDPIFNTGKGKSVVCTITMEQVDDFMNGFDKHLEVCKCNDTTKPNETGPE